MKKILIIAGIVIILVLIGAWVYLANQNAGPDGVFANFGFGDTTDDDVTLEPFTDSVNNFFDTPPVENPLRQLTTVPVVAYETIQKNASSSPLTYYVEDGTSHVYSIDPVTYDPIRLSNITVTDVSSAVISRDGQYVALMNDEITILTLPGSVGGEVQSFTIYESGMDLKIIGNQLLYVTETASGAAVKQYELGSKLAAETLFDIPFREVAMAWGNSVSGPHYYYPKPAANLSGYLYLWEDGVVAREPISEVSLSGHQVGGYFLYKNDSSGLNTYLHLDQSVRSLFVNSIPEKCSDDISRGPLVCAEPTDWSNDYERWLRGELQTKDELVLLDISSGNSRILDGLTDNALDIVGIKSVSNGLLFVDRANSVLWHYQVDW